jgi:hypothetical protein
VKNIRNFFICAVLIALGYGVNTFVNSLSEVKVSHESSLVPATGAREALLDKKIAELELQIKELQSHQALVFAKNINGGSNDTSPRVATQNLTPEKESANPPADELTALRDYQAQNEINKHNEYLKSINATPLNIASVLSDHFAKESIDYKWAAEKKGVLDTFVATDKSLASLPNISSECKSQQCKLSFIGDDQSYLANLSDSLGKIVSDKQQDFDSYTTVIDDKNHTTSIYFERNGSHPSASKALQ